MKYGIVYLYEMLFSSNYPVSRVTKDSNEVDVGVAGTLQLVQNTVLSTQPISSFDWSPDKEGLCVCTAFDQVLRVLIVTRLKSLWTCYLNAHLSTDSWRPKNGWIILLTKMGNQLAPVHIEVMRVCTNVQVLQFSSSDTEEGQAQSVYNTSSFWFLNIHVQKHCACTCIT